MPATTVENLVTSPRNALRPNKKTLDLPDSKTTTKTTTTNAQKPSASIVEASVTWLVIAQKVK